MLESYRIELASSAAKEIAALPAAIAERIRAKIDRLATTPRPPDVKKLKDAPLWRVRVGDYRIIYSVDDRAKIVDIVRVRHRSKAYE